MGDCEHPIVIGFYDDENRRPRFLCALCGQEARVVDKDSGENEAPDITKQQVMRAMADWN